jgi:imidazolonepropionase-like amidohydrolase
MRTQFFKIAVLLLFFALVAPTKATASDLALVHAKVYVSPSDPPLEDATILIHDGQITAVGPSSKTKPPHFARAVTVIDCKGMVVTAGFWNSHVHILLPSLLHAETKSAAELSTQLDEMLNRWGFTTVFDIASVLENTNAIRRRINSGEVRGPRIFTVGEPFWMKNGTPIYVQKFLETYHIHIPEVDSPDQGVARVKQQIHDGADAIKIFANSIEEHEILNMPLELAKPIVAEAHREKKLVFAHVSNQQGIEVALQSGVDILAHTTTEDEPWSPELIARLKKSNTALVPTLGLFHWEMKNMPSDKFEAAMSALIVPKLRAYSKAGGQILFGTDVGYTQQFNTSEEFMWMSRADMSFTQILASLTTNPAQRFGYSNHSGRIGKGMDADLVVLSADPAQDTQNFSKVAYTIRQGKIIFGKP